MVPSGLMLGDLFAVEFNMIQEYHNLTRYNLENQPAREDNISIIKQHLDGIISNYQAILEEFQNSTKPKCQQPVNLQPINLQPINLQPLNLQTLNIQPQQPMIYIPPNTEALQMQATSYLSFSSPSQFAITNYTVPGSEVVYAISSNADLSHEAPNPKLPLPPMSIISVPAVSVGEQKSTRKSVKVKHQACTSCHTLSTAQWRSGPCGPRTLCNRCGLRFAKSKRTQSIKNSPLSSNPVASEDVDKLIN